MIAISAHIAEPVRPITISAVSTGPSSLIRLNPTADPSKLTEPKRTSVS